MQYILIMIYYITFFLSLVSFILKPFICTVYTIYTYIHSIYI